MVFKAFEAILIFIIIISVGVLTSRLRWSNNKAASDFIAKLVLNVTFPVTIVYSFLNRITKAELIDNGWLLAVCIMGVFAAFVVAEVASAAVRIDKKRRGVFSVLFSAANAGFIGFPVALAIFVGRGFIYAVIYFIANNLLMNTCCYMAIMRDGYQNRKLTVLFWIRKCLNPLIISVIIGITLVLCEIKPPLAVNNALSYMDALTTPLSLMLIGMEMYDTGLKNMKFERDLVMAVLGKFILCPLIMLAFCLIFGIAKEPTMIFCVQSGLPALSSTVLFAKAAGGDSAFAAKGVVWTTLLSMLILPLYVAIFGMQRI